MHLYFYIHAIHRIPKQNCNMILSVFYKICFPDFERAQTHRHAINHQPFHYAQAPLHKPFLCISCPEWDDTQTTAGQDLLSADLVYYSCYLSSAARRSSRVALISCI